MNRIYSAGRQQHFENIADVHRSIGHWNRGQKALQPLTLKPTGAQRDLADYIKHRFCVQDAVLSIPCEFIGAEALPDDGAAINNYDDLYDNLAAHALDRHDVAANTDVYVFQVINAFPEKRSVHRVGHVQRNEWIIHINFSEWVPLA